MSDTPHNEETSVSDAAGPTSSPEHTVLLTNQQAGSAAPTETQAPETPQPRVGSGTPESQAEPSVSPFTTDKITEADEHRPANAPARKVDPMQGMKLEAILQELVGYFGWEEMGYRINIRCFNEDPSIGSSLKFLRKTPWARKKVDALFLTMRAEQAERAEPAGETAPL